MDAHHGATSHQAAEEGVGTRSKPTGAKPAEANTNRTNSELERSRRSFLKLGMGVLGTLTLAEVAGAGLLYLQPRPLDGEFGGQVHAGAVDSFPPGSVTEFPAGRFFLIRAQDGGFLAVYRRCTHLGCAVGWEAGASEFVCPCHGSHFSFVGDVQNPPALGALDTFRLTIVDGEVRVDTGHVIPREHFTETQMVYA